MFHSICLSSLRTESCCHYFSRPGEAPAVPSAILAIQHWKRSEEPDLRVPPACREPLGGCRAEPELPGSSETTSTALWAVETSLPHSILLLLVRSPKHCDPEPFQLCQRPLITVKTNTAYDRLELSPVTTDKGQCL